MWVCTLEHADGPTVTIVWTLSGQTSIQVPAGATIAYRFAGDAEPVAAGSSISVGITPIMFAPSALPSLS